MIPSGRRRNAGTLAEHLALATFTTTLITVPATSSMISPLAGRSSLARNAQRARLSDARVIRAQSSHLRNLRIRSIDVSLPNPSLLMRLALAYRAFDGAVCGNRARRVHAAASAKARRWTQLAAACHAQPRAVAAAARRVRGGRPARARRRSLPQHAGRRCVPRARAAGLRRPRTEVRRGSLSRRGGGLPIWCGPAGRRSIPRPSWATTRKRRARSSSRCTSARAG